MKAGSLTAAAALTAAKLFGDSFSLNPDQLPARPGIPVAYVDGQRHMIVAFRGNDPVIIKNGARVTVHDARISIVPGESFAPGYVMVDQGKSTQWKDTFDTYGDVRKSSYTSFEGTFTADRDYSDVYIILLEFEDIGDAYSEAPKVAILGSNVGRLEAGKKKSVYGTYPPLTSDKGLRWVGLVFSAGVQIHCSTDGNLLDSLFDSLDHVGLQKVVAQRNTGDYPIMVFRRFPLAFGDALKAAYAGRTVNVRLHIAPSGTIDFADSDDPGSGALVREVTLQMRHWLFLPRIKDGMAQEGIVVLPVKF